MRARLLGAVLFTVTALGLAGCTEVPPLEGTITNKYIEDYTEHTIVLTDANGTEHHFAVEREQWLELAEGQPFNTNQLDQPAED